MLPFPVFHIPPAAAFNWDEIDDKSLLSGSSDKFEVRTLALCSAFFISNHAKEAHKRQSVFPVPVGDSSTPFFPWNKYNIFFNMKIL